MSASDKKKLRKEQSAAAMTEKQQAEQKKQKTVKAYTLTFVIAMILVVALVLASVLTIPVQVLMAKGTNALTVGTHDINAIEFNYFYGDVISNFYGQYSDYGTYQDLYVQLYTGLNPAKSLDEQVYNSETGDTWADYFIDAAISNATWTYAMVDKANAEGYTLSEDELKSMENVEAFLELYAAYYGYSNANGYLKALYGNSATIESYMEYYKTSTLASSFANTYLESLGYTAEELREYEADKLNQYNAYTYAFYTIDVDDYLTGGTIVTGDDGKDTTVYSDEEKAAALAAALADAETLVGATISSIEDFDAEIQKLAINADSKTEVTSASFTDQSYYYVDYYANYYSTDIRDWVIDDARTEGELTYIAITSTDEDKNETTDGYYVIYFGGSIDNTAKYIGTVRHLLVAFEEDDDDNVTDEAKAEAKAKAEELLAEYKAGELTEEAFTALIKEHSDDTEDGLYEEITPDSNYVENFRNWATAEHEVGDVEIVETDYGYHIMYYVSCEGNYRDYMIENDMIEEAYTEWEEAILETVEFTEGNQKYVNRDMIISG